LHIQSQLLPGDKADDGLQLPTVIVEDGVVQVATIGEQGPPGAAVGDATNNHKGAIKVAGDLGGTADLPTVPGLAGKESTIVARTTSQYWRGDKTWQTLDKAAVGLGNVPNIDATSRANHTGTQLASTISDFSTAAGARISIQEGAANGLTPLGSDGEIGQHLPTGDCHLRYVCGRLSGRHAHAHR
jgi:hypothetical protein